MRELTHQDVVLRPVITEKTLRDANRHNTYTFRVRPTANKVQIRDAIERIFKVGVSDVRTQKYRGKRRRVGRSLGFTQAWKKAVICVKDGDSIDFY